MVKFIALSGFLGAGKTTTMTAAAKEMERRGERVAIITNDQGTELVDTQMARAAVDTVGEVTGGCFCCRFDDLLDVAGGLIDSSGASVLLAEAVGSCTDLQATVIRPLAQLYGGQFSVSPLTTVVEADRLRALRSALPLDDEESDLSYLFGKQLEEAEVIAVNKIDLLDPATVEKIVAQLEADYPAARVVPYSALTGEGVSTLVDAWLAAEASGPDMLVDYERYARAEAQLAWLNNSFALKAPAGFLAVDWANTVLRHLSTLAAQRGWIIGHAKIGVDSAGGLTKLSVTASGAEPTVDCAEAEPTSFATAHVNARVACEPDAMDAAILAAVAVADAAYGVSSTGVAGAPAFKPGYPTPVHRLARGAA